MIYKNLIRLMTPFVLASQLASPVFSAAVVYAETTESVAGTGGSIAGNDVAVVNENPQSDNNIERFSINWSTPDEDDDAARLHQIWTDNEKKEVSYKITYALSGKSSYDVGAVIIKIPKTVFTDRNGNPIGSSRLGVPKAPDANSYFAYTETETEYVITNQKKLPAASSGTIDVTITDLTPSEIKDFASGYVSSKLSGDLTIVTNSGQTLTAKSNELDATVDTQVAISSGYTRHNTTVYSTYPDSWDPALKPENANDFYYATFSVYATSKSNQYYSVDITDNVRSSEDARNAQLLGFKYSKNGQIYRGVDGTLSQRIEDNVRLADGQQFSGTVYVAYPKADFTEDRPYSLKNTVEFVMTAQDDQQVTTTTAEATLPFRPVVVESPRGSFYVEKRGDGPVVTKFGSPSIDEGIYGTHFNKLLKNEEVEVWYDIQTRALGGPWTLKDGGNPENLADYGFKTYKLITEDFKTTFNENGIELNVDSFRFKSLNLREKPLARVFSKNIENVQNEYVKKEFTGADGQPLFGYSTVPDSEIPEVTVFGKVNNTDEWIEYGTVSYKTGRAVITTKNGASVADDVNLVFPDNVTDYKTEVETSLASWHHDIEPHVILKPTDDIKAQITALYDSGIQPMAKMSNHVRLEVVTDNNTNRMFVNEFVGRDRLSGFSDGAKPEKTLVSYKNDLSNRKVDLSYQLSNYIYTNITDKAGLKEAIEDGLLKEQKEATFYDLLPKGVIPITSSIKTVRKGDSIQSIEAIENYKDSGRTLLKVKVKLTPDYKYEYNSEKNILKTPGYYDKPSITFDARYPWSSLNTYGKELENLMAYESGNASLGNVAGLSGENDNASGTNNSFTVTAFNDEQEKTWMTDLNADHDNPSFVYGRTDSRLNIETNSSTNLSKLVDVNNEGLYNDGLDESLAKNVYTGGRYSYLISIKNTDTNKSKDLIFYDNLENFKPTAAHSDFGDDQWKGTFTGVNLDNMRSLGVAPVVYYSTKDNLVLDNEDDRSDNDLSNKQIWTTEMPEDKTQIKAVAIDASKRTDGSEFILGETEEISAKIIMVAPTNVDESVFDKQLKAGETEAGATGGSHAYNNIVMTGRQISVETGSISSNLMIRNDYVKVGLRPYNISVNKSWSDDNNRDGLRTDEAVIKLLADGKDTGKKVTVNYANNWSNVFKQLPYFNDKNQPITYSLVEESLSGYTFEIANAKQTDEGVHYDVVNNHTPERVNIKGTKIWNDTNELNRPPYITVNLKADGKVIQSIDVRPDDKGVWSYEFKNLYKFKDEGTKIKYTVEEKDYVTGYVQEVNDFDIVNTYDPYTDVTIGKKVTNATDAAKAKNTDFRFTFIVNDLNGNLVNDKEYDYETSTGRTGKITSGNEFTLKADETITVKKVDSEYVVTVREINLPKGYSIVSPNNVSKVLQAGILAKFEFNNKYDTRGSVSFDVNKQLTGRKLFPNEFKFKLLKDGQIIRTASNDTEGKVNFGLIHYTKEDVGNTYEYTIVEDDTAKGGVTYDNHTETISVKVVDNGDGTIVPEVTYDADGAVFKNDYHARGTVSFKAWKQMKYNQPLKDKQFSFELRDGNGVVATGTNDANGVITFSDIEFTEKHVGKKYTYTATEVVDPSQERTIDFDTSSLTYEVEVLDNYDGTLSFNAVGRDDYTGDVNNNTATPLFVNKYKDGNLIIQKETTNGDNTTEFRFKVKIKGDADAVPKGPVDIERKPIEKAPANNSAPVSSGTTIIENLVSSAKTFIFGEKVYAETVPGPSGAVTQTGTFGTVTWDLYENGHLVFRPTDGVSGTMGVITRVNGNVDRPAFWQHRHDIKSISFEPGVQPNSDSSYLFSGMFPKLGINFDNFDTSNVTNMFHMFEYFGGGELETLDLSSFDTSNVTNMDAMFYGSGLTSLDLSSFDTSKVTNMWGMFFDARNLTSLDLSSFDTSNVESMTNMFKGASSLTSLDLSSFDTSKVTDMAGMFQNARNLTSLDLSSFDTSKVTDMAGMFQNASGLTSLDLSSFDTSKVTNMSRMFQNASSLTSLDLSSFDASNLTNVSNMFSGLHDLTSLKVSLANSKVTDMSGLFSNLPNLTSLDLSTFDTSNVTNMSSMFARTPRLTSLDLSLFDTSKVTSMAGMFQNASGLTSLDLSSFDTSKVTNMSRMFQNASGLTSLDLSSFDTSKVTITAGMFHNARSINTITLPENLRFRNGIMTVIEPPSDAVYTGKWIKEDGSQGPFTRDELKANWDASFAGTWVWETAYTLTFDTAGSGELIPNQSVRPNTDFKLPIPTVRPFGKNFVGWTYNDTLLPDTVRNLADGGQTAQLIAKWEDVDNTVDIQDGEFYVTMYGGESVTLKNLPAGLTYEVYEETPEGWVLLSERNTSGSIEPALDSLATFENTPSDTATSVKIQAKKLLDGKGTGGFEFELLENNQVIERVTSSNDGTINFNTIAYTEEGQHTYTIREVQKDDNSINFDTTIHTITVTVTKNIDNKFEATVEGNNPVFNNATRTADLTVRKVVNNSSDKLKQFTFRAIINGKEEIFNLTSGQSKTFEDIKVGSTYDIDEINIPDGYNLTSITNAEGVITDTTDVEIVATNDYIMNGSILLSGRKILENKDLASGDFEFQLLDESGNIIDTAKNAADGAILFNTIRYTKPGEYVYQIKEVSGNEKNITYDKHVETVRVVASDAGNGQLQVVANYDEDGAVFTNTFEPPIDVPAGDKGNVTITKTVEGKETNQSFNIKVDILDENKQLVQSKFKYTSTIHEGEREFVAGEKLEIRADETITIKDVAYGYAIKVTEDAYKGFTVKSDSHLEEVVDKTQEDLQLTNVYEAHGQVTFEGSKELLGGRISNYRFSFLVLHEGDIVQRVTNDSNGQLKFTPVVFDNTDIGKTYEYEIVEEDTKDPTINYDKSVKKVQVTVEDNGDGTLNVTASSPDGIVFKNSVKNDLPATGNYDVAIVFILLTTIVISTHLYSRRRTSL